MSEDLIVNAYLADVERELESGVATEHTFRPALKTLIERLGDVHATNEPRRSACGAPDYSVWRPDTAGPRTIGYVEAKDVGVSLAAAEASEQLSRYRDALPNLVLTDYLEFRWYTDGQLRRTERLADVAVDGQVSAKDAAPVLGLLGDFLAMQPAAIDKPAELARRMARLTRLIRDIVVATFANGLASQTITDLHLAFEEVLIPNLNTSDFADMFAQTLGYGLFAARVNHAETGPFRREAAAHEIPRTNPFLRRLFGAITGPELDDEPYVGLVDDLAQLLAEADIKAILAKFGSEAARNDPVIHFYETFLAAYDPVVRERRGVYYTPQPLVSYIVGSVDHVLRDAFDLPNGFAEVSRRTPAGAPPQSKQVLILDPACGTGTFLYSIINRIRAQYAESGDAGKWPAFVRDQLLPRLFGFELLVAPYAVAHLKLAMQLAGQDLPESERAEWAYGLDSGERLGIYLTNTLEEAVKKSELLLGSYIAEEANAAADIKRALPILVVLGNPPYSGHSANEGPWIRQQVAAYSAPQPGIPKPSQGKWLQDDYIKFIRFGEWRIEQTGAGVLAFVTNHSYLDSPTFAGMRRHLMETFSDIYVLDLHGNAKKAERSPDGSPDQNVFDIQQGVVISVFVKQAETEGLATIHRADLYGTRDHKYAWLGASDIGTTAWTTVQPTAPHYRFAEQDADIEEEYAQWWSVADIMSENGKPAPGIVTTHDQFAISMTEGEAREKVQRLLATSSEGDARKIWRLCKQSQWNYANAKKELATGDWEAEVRPVLYRPFDIRWTVFDSNVAVHRRERITAHMQAGPNVGLVTSKLTKGEDFAHAQVTRVATEAICMSPKTSNNGFLFPLYLYAASSGKQRRLLIGDEPTGRRANLNPAFLAELAAHTGLSFVPDGPGDLENTFGPEDVLHYMHAVLHTPSYRSRFVEPLRHDFPRIPLPPDGEPFAALAAKGAELVGVQLMDTAVPTTVNFPVPGTNVVASGHPKYLPAGSPEPFGDGVLDAGRVYISADAPKKELRGQYFRGVPTDAWEFRIGGYQVCEKWLRDRRGVTLTFEDIDHYARIVGVVSATIDIMAQLDALVPAWPLSSAPLATAG
jgi:Type ISP C-terminal specificity domain/N-6 DNA Methylase